MTLLTIGIPTYNRANYLGKLLAKIMPECERLGVEVLVSDNASTDDTAGIAARFSSIRYLRNPRNLGFDGNILNLLDTAAGRFLWLLGDDDSLDVERLPEIVQLLKSSPSTGLFFVSYRYDTSKKKGKVQLTSVTVGPQTYVDSYLHRATLISTNIIDRQTYQQLSLDRQCVVKGWIHLHLLVLLAEKLRESGGRITVVKDRIVIQGTFEGDYPIERYIQTFVDNFSFTLNHSPAPRLTLAKLKKHFYDINVRLRLLNFKDIASQTKPEIFYAKAVKAFNFPWSGRLSFWLQYFLAKKLFRSRR